MDRLRKNKHFWQAVKFMLVSCAVGILQLLLANLLPIVFNGVKATIPPILQPFFDPNVLFNRDTARGAMEYAMYVVDGIVTWGYVLPFFLSNLLANTYGYFQNRKTTFKSDSPPICFVIYFFVLIVLILVSTWLQGYLVGKLNGTGIAVLGILSRTIAAAAAGLLQLIVLFPLEKFVLMKEKKTE